MLWRQSECVKKEEAFWPVIELWHRSFVMRADWSKLESRFFSMQHLGHDICWCCAWSKWQLKKSIWVLCGCNNLSQCRVSNWVRELNVSLGCPFSLFGAEINDYNILLINREWGHYRGISDRGLDVLTERQRGQYIKDEVWDFPVMIERTRLISYLLYGFFSAFL